MIIKTRIILITIIIIAWQETNNYKMWRNDVGAMVGWAKGTARRWVCSDYSVIILNHFKLFLIITRSYLQWTWNITDAPSKWINQEKKSEEYEWRTLGGQDGVVNFTSPVAPLLPSPHLRYLLVPSPKNNTRLFITNYKYKQRTKQVNKSINKGRITTKDAGRTRWRRAPYLTVAHHGRSLTWRLNSSTLHPKTTQLPSLDSPARTVSPHISHEATGSF